MRETASALVRTATDIDIGTITEIYAHHVLHSAATFEIEPPDEPEMLRRRLEIQSHDLPYLVVQKEGRVVGYAYAAPYRPRPAYRFSVEDSIYIHTDFRSQGLGRLLLAKLVEICSVHGKRQMVAIIGDSENAASIRLHANFGFRTVGVLERVGRKFGRWIDTVIMQRELRDARRSAFRDLLEGLRNSSVDLQHIADFLRRIGDYRWVGLYEVDSEAGEIRNLVFSGVGPPVHPVFPIDKGLTGKAVHARKTVKAGDVTADPAYLTAFGTTQSELIVPVFNHSRTAVIGTIDVESDKLQAFSDEDQIFLEDCSDALRHLWKFEKPGQ